MDDTCACVRSSTLVPISISDPLSFTTHTLHLKDKIPLPHQSTIADRQRTDCDEQHMFRTSSEETGRSVPLSATSVSCVQNDRPLVRIVDLTVGQMLRT